MKASHLILYLYIFLFVLSNSICNSIAHWPEFCYGVLNAMLFWVWGFFCGIFLIIQTHLIQSLVTCMSNLKLFLSACHLFLCSSKAQLPSRCPICSFLISHPEEHDLLWPTLEWSCSDTTLYNKIRDSCFSVQAVTELLCTWQKLSSCLLNG